MNTPDQPVVRFHDGKAPDAMRTIGEVAVAFDIKPHVLRYWEQQFPMLTPLKRSGGRRLYRPEDVALVERIDDLVNRQGFTLKGACQALANDAKADAPTVAAPQTSNDSVLPQLRAIRTRLASALDA